jgi:hypothetical protein
MMGTLILVVVIVFLAAALGLACLEQAGGYVGESGLVPGYLGIMVLVVVAILVVGALTGYVGFWIK